MITPRDRFIVAMKGAIPPVGEARNDHDILRGISRLLDVETKFSGSKSTDEWLEWIYDESRSMARQIGTYLPDYKSFQAAAW